MRYTMDEANRLRGQLGELADPLSRAALESEQPVQVHLERWGSFDTADVLGSGPALGSAAFAVFDLGIAPALLLAALFVLASADFAVRYLRISKAEG